MSRYVDSDGFLGRCDITAGRSTARRVLTPCLRTLRFARNANYFFALA
jgi:hypothetical protein